MNKTKLVKELRQVCDSLAFNRKACDDIAQYCNDAFGVPLGHVKDLISDRISLEGISNKELFFLTDGITQNTSRDLLTRYFSEKEIEEYRNTIYEDGSLEWPLRINCIEVNENKQWIGAIDVKWLMDLYKANKIKYNADKQRTRTKLIKDDKVIFQNTIVKKSVNQIAALMASGDYIPDDITLDIPEEANAKYEYNEEFSELLIEHIDFFDITDGYHRFQAMLRCVEENPDFNYPMELRITKFSEQRSRQFIYQKDQKNRMTERDSRSLNVYRNSNEIVTRLNERGNGCQFSGLIQRNSGTVDYAALSDIVEYYWIKGNGRWKTWTARELIIITSEVKEILNRIAMADPYYLDSKYLDFKRLIVIFWLVKDKQKSVEQAVNILHRLEKKGDLDKIKLKTLRKNLFDQLEEVVLK